jgi:trehalose synthase
MAVRRSLRLGLYNSTLAHADGRPGHPHPQQLHNVGAIEVNAFQSLSDVVIQKSTREGFGLTVSEALWKGRPFIGGNVGGIPLQVEDGVSGYLVDTVEACGRRIMEILEDPGLGRSLGLRGKEHVRANFLTPRYLRDYLKIFHEVL